MNLLPKSVSRFAAFLLLSAIVAFPLSVAFSLHGVAVAPAAGPQVLTADGTQPAPPPIPLPGKKTS